MKKILGLDLGTTSIGWALVNKAEDKQENASDNNNEKSSIEACGSRIIPMNAKQLDNFGKGVKVSATAERTLFRGTRRRYERGHLRRSRLNVVLSILGLLPVPSSRPDCPGFAILSLSACASLCSSDRIRVLTLSVFLLVSIGSWQLLPRTSWRISPLPAHRPEPRRICVCFHKTATRISRFLSDGSCM